MTTTTNDGIPASVAAVEVSRFRSASRKTDLRGPDLNAISIKRYHPDLNNIIGETPTYSLVLSSADSSRNPFFYNACVYIPEHGELYATSDLLQSTSSSRLPTVLISQVKFKLRTSPLHNESERPAMTSIESVSWTKLRPPSTMPMPAGAIRYKNGVLYCSQGTMESASGGLFYMPRGKPPMPILTRLLGNPGRSFNSIHSVTQDTEGCLWFTDPSIGFEEEIRPKPKLPPGHVYRYRPETGDLRVVADGFRRPTGIAFVAGTKGESGTLYVSDTAADLGGGRQDSTLPATIYAFDIIHRHGSPFLTNKRVFAYAAVGVPREIVCDGSGNVYAACGDGVEIWSPGGVALGLIDVPGGCSSLCFGSQDLSEMFIGAGQRLWRLRLFPVRKSELTDHDDLMDE
ncbi:calcium-dependent phosphotriesterase [Xylariomycetidae sp. FL2044]|nr:calcium-dependent phosphotriesterase [Xylariomycetidae sp. FL2044]